MKYELTAKRLREALNDCNMTAQDLVNSTGINKSSISQYVNGSHTIGNVKAYQIGKVLKVNPLWLMGFEDVDKQERLTSFYPDMSEEEINYSKEYTLDAIKLYNKYIAADKKTRKMIDMLLEEGD